jgi:FixJ family two-component response regulator
MQEEYLIFVIDNDLSARRGICRILQTAGYHACALSSVEEYIECFNSDESGCMIIDAGIPDRAVKALLDKFNAHGVVHLPIIVITSEDDTNSRRKAAKLKASGFFRKPVDSAALLDAVNWAIRFRIKE